MACLSGKGHGKNVRSCQKVARTLLESCQKVARKFPESCLKLPKSCQKVAKKLQESGQKVARPESHETVIRQSWDSHETVRRRSWDSHETVMRKSWDTHETVRWQSWDSHETVYYSTPVAGFADMSVLVCSHPTSQNLDVLGGKSGGSMTMALPFRQKAMVKTADNAFYFKHGFLLLFLHNSHGTKEIPDCGNLVRPDWVGNLRWDNTEPYEPFRWVNTEPSVQFRKANTDLSVQFRKANTDPSMQFRWGHRKFLFC